MTLRIQLNSGGHLTLISVYGPTMQRTQEEKEIYNITSARPTQCADVYTRFFQLSTDNRCGSIWCYWFITIISCSSIPCT